MFNVDRRMRSSRCLALGLTLIVSATVKSGFAQPPNDAVPAPKVADPRAAARAADPGDIAPAEGAPSSSTEVGNWDQGAPAARADARPNLTGKTVAAPDVPRLGSGPRLTWQPGWRRFSTFDYVLTGIAASVVVAGYLIAPSPGRWPRGEAPLDEGGRDTLRLRNHSDATRARDASDLLLSIGVAYPFLVDSLIVAWWHHDSPDVAEQMALMSVEALAVTAALQGLSAGFTSRERPYGRTCGNELDERNGDCTSRTRYRAFFSGHTSASFATAGVICSHHAHLPLYGGGVGDALVCALGFVNAGAVGMFRIMSDQHYVSDVVMGATVGTLGGLALPWLLHYRNSNGKPGARYTRPAVALSVLPTTSGATIGGVF